MLGLLADEAPTIFAIVLFSLLGIAAGGLVIDNVVGQRSSQGRLEKLQRERHIKDNERARRARILDNHQSPDTPLAELYRQNISLLEKEIAELDTRIEALKCEIELEKLEKGIRRRS